MARDNKGRFLKGHNLGKIIKRSYANCLSCGEKVRTFKSRQRKFCNHPCALRFQWKNNKRDNKIIREIHGKHFKGYKNSGSFEIEDKRISKQNNPNWKGGISKLNELIRKMPEYNEWRTKVFSRDNFTCKCGEKGCYIEAHHLKQFKIILLMNQIKTIKQARKCRELWDINNGQTLCKPCHNKTK